MSKTQTSRINLIKRFARALLLLAVSVLFVISCSTAPASRNVPSLPDAKRSVETGSPPDSGAPADSGPPADSGTPAESGKAVDSGKAVNSGTAVASKSQRDSGTSAQTAVIDSLPPVAVSDEWSLRFLPRSGPEFWETMMTAEVAFEYRAINGVSQCTRFVADMLDLHFGRDAYLQVFPSGVLGANQTFLEWAENKSLVRLLPEEYSISDIQRLANQGYLILMAYYFPDVAGHVAFVGHNALNLFTIPPLDGLEGKHGGSLNSRWLPVMVQAGTYTGVTSMVYATNNWLRNDNYQDGIVRYYFVEDGGATP